MFDGMYAEFLRLARQIAKWEVEAELACGEDLDSIERLVERLKSKRDRLANQLGL